MCERTSPPHSLSAPANRYRHCVSRRGGMDYKWQLEFLKDGNWPDDTTTALLLLPFFLPKHERVLQNHMLE